MNIDKFFAIAVVPIIVGMMLIIMPDSPSQEPEPQPKPHINDINIWTHNGMTKEQYLEKKAMHEQAIVDRMKQKVLDAKYNCEEQGRNFYQVSDTQWFCTSGGSND